LEVPIFTHTWHILAWTSDADHSNKNANLRQLDVGQPVTQFDPVHGCGKMKMNRKKKMANMEKYVSSLGV
jgi:hypothetical protein